MLLPYSGSAQALAEPSITPLIGGTLGANGWYRSAVSVVWQIQPAPDPGTIVGCQPVTIAADTSRVTVSCSAKWGSVGKSESRDIKVDKTPPAVTSRASRSPDSNGWYNHAVGIVFSGTDRMSGIASCTATTYAGPDNTRAVVPGGCTDRAGNGAGGSVALAYDSTPPQLKKLRAKHGFHAVIFKWQVSADTQRIVVERVPGKKKRNVSSTVYSGKASSFRDKGLHVGTQYRYTVSVFDAAGNKVRRTVRMTGTGKLFAPAPGASVKGAPRLEWAAVRGATYYNVLLVRNGTVFSAWPKGTSLKLPRSWVYHGNRQRLHRGVYRWYVWPGFGARSANKYGRMVGRSSFFFAG